VAGATWWRCGNEFGQPVAMERRFRAAARQGTLIRHRIQRWWNNPANGCSVAPPPRMAQQRETA